MTTMQRTLTDPETLQRNKELAEQIVDRIFVHHEGTEQDRYIDAFGAEVLPQLGDRGAREAR